jgi:hypothetical protein
MYYHQTKDDGASCIYSAVCTQGGPSGCQQPAASSAQIPAALTYLTCLKGSNERHVLCAVYTTTYNMNVYYDMTMSDGVHHQMVCTPSDIVICTI